MIDVGAFAEWILAKAEKQHGASSTDDANLRAVRAAVERAIAASGDEVHVTCTLEGSAGPVQIDERLTRTAAENLFETHSHVPAHKSSEREPREKEEAKRNAQRDEERERVEKRIAEIRQQRKILLVIAAIATVILVSVIFAVERKEHGADRDHAREKRETHH